MLGICHYFCSVQRSLEENGSFNPGKEMKAETQTYYQALIDNRDSPFIVSEYMAVGTSSGIFEVI